MPEKWLRDARVRPEEIVGTVDSKESFIGFMECLRSDLERNSEDWENPTLERYLDALQSWLQAQKSSYPQTENPWSALAAMLVAAKMYE